jgi:hypothetical protein
MGKKLLISENEKNRILDLYGILKKTLNEATPTTPASPSTTSSVPQTFEKKIMFGPGHYMLSSKGSYVGRDKKTYDWDVDRELKDGLNGIKSFLKSNPTGYVVGVKLESGESNIPNDDAMEGGADLKPGELSDKRMATLKGYFGKIKEEWSKEGINTSFQVTEEKSPGKTKWKGSIFCPDTASEDEARKGCYTRYIAGINKGDKRYTALRDAYETEQFFRIIISVNKLNKLQPPKPGLASKDCLQGMKIEYNYDEVVENYEGHCCLRGRFNLFANGVQLNRNDGNPFASIDNGLGDAGVKYLQQDSRPQTVALGHRFKKDAVKSDDKICYSEKNKNAVGKDGRDLYNKSSESKPGMYRYNTFTITPQQAFKITKETGGRPGILKIEAAATSDNTNPHKEAVRVTVYRPDGTLAYDNCEGGECTGGSYGPWNINFCPASTPTT